MAVVTEYNKEGNPIIESFGSIASAAPKNRIAIGITIEAPNLPPVFATDSYGVSTLLDISRVENTAVLITVTATDPAPESKSTIWDLQLPSALNTVLSIASVDSVSGLISGTLPSFIDGDNNQYTVVVEASDGDGNAATEDFIITVEQANQPPTVLHLISFSQVEGSDFSVQVYATDLDDDALIYSLGFGPEGFTPAPAFETDSDGVSSTGLMTGTLPSYEEGGTNQFTIIVEVSDGTVTTTQSFIIIVLPDADLDGVQDDDDFCPETGEVLTITIDANGCSPSQLDSDSDGVQDIEDLCANTNLATDYY